MLGNLGSMMRQLQEAQQRAEKMQEELANERIEATAGGGAVICVVNGTGEVLELKLDAEKLGLPAEQAEELADTVLAAVSAATAEARARGRNLLEELTGGLQLPPGLGL